MKGLAAVTRVFRSSIVRYVSHTAAASKAVARLRSPALASALLETVHLGAVSASAGLRATTLGVESLQELRGALNRGVLPSPSTLRWPHPALVKAWLGVLSELDLAEMTRRHPSLTELTLLNLLETVRLFDSELNQHQAQEPASIPLDDIFFAQDSSDDADGAQNDGDAEGSSSTADSNDSGSGGGGSSSNGGGEAGSGGDGGGSTSDTFSQDTPVSSDAQMDDVTPGEGGGTAESSSRLELAQETTGGNGSDERSACSDAGLHVDGALGLSPSELREADAAERLAQEFAERFKPQVDEVKRATEASLAMGGEGTNLESGSWDARGLIQLERALRKLSEPELEQQVLVLPDYLHAASHLSQSYRRLRRLADILGRAGTHERKRRRLPRQYEGQLKCDPLGVVASPLQPLETESVGRSSDLSRMLASETALLAGSSKRRRLLLRARAAEGSLASYERSGWLEWPAHTSERVREFRPSVERGPILVALDTSMSMVGELELVAKAATLACVRDAHRSKRRCFLFAFSGPGACAGQELSLDPRGMQRLIGFLGRSFHGGTDVHRPLQLCLELLRKAEWRNADLLFVSDGKFSAPGNDVAEGLQAAKFVLGLRVHGLHLAYREYDVVEPEKAQNHDDDGERKDVGGGLRDVCTDIHFLRI